MMQSLRVDIFAELTRAGIFWQYTNSPTWLNIRCPFHDDKTPSAYVETEQQYFTCKACNARGDIPTLLARQAGKDKWEIVLDLQQRYGKAAKDKPIEPEYVEKLHRQIWQALPLLEQLYKRGISNDLIRYYRLGEQNGKITIPIPNANGVWVDVLKYAPGAADKKFTHMSGRGNVPRLYPIEQLHYNNLLICGGPLKAAAAAYELNAFGIGCVSSTNGETWPKNLEQQVGQRDWICICLDIDKAGQIQSQEIASRFSTLAGFIGILTLPLDKDKYPKGDISDWIGQEKKLLKPLLDTVTRWEPVEIEAVRLEAETPEPSTILGAVSAENTNKRLSFRALVTAVEFESFKLTRNVRVECDRKQLFCGKCPIYSLPAVPTLNLSPESEHLLGMINQPRKVQHELIRQALSVPICKSVKFTPGNYYNAHQVRLTPDLDSYVDFKEDGTAVLDAVTVGCELQLNETYDVVGRVVPHPNTQRATAIISRVSEVVDTLAAYRLQPEQLEKFKPGEWTPNGIQAKLNEIYTEFASRVTHIEERQDLHLLDDLAFHSVLYLPADGRLVKGYVEVLQVGDSSQGKSDTPEFLMRHYGLGTKVDMSNATVAGLLGGVAEAGRRKYISWGILPANDRRLVFLEELKKANPEILGKLTETRSSGKADIPKIERGKANARTRLIVSSNARSGVPMAAFTYGLEAIRELIPNLEDIRRFDACLILDQNEVSKNINQYKPSLNGTAAPLTYDSVSCRNLVLYAWTRRPEQVKFEDWPHLLSQAGELCLRFIDSVPIVDRGSMRFKLARLATALAVRTYSTLDPETVYVRSCHVDYITGWLYKIYTTKAFGYDRFSQAILEQSRLTNVDYLIQRISNLSAPRAFVECMLRANQIDLQLICDWLTCERHEAALIISDLVRNHAIVRDGRAWYRKTPQFIELLQKLTNLPDKVAVPNYVQGVT